MDDHHLTIQTTKYLETDEENVPTGNVKDGYGTFMDFSQGKYLTKTLLDQTPNGYGFDNNFCFASSKAELEIHLVVRWMDGWMDGWVNGWDL